MSVRQLTHFIESFRDRLNTLEQQISELPKTQTQSEQISQTFAALQTSLERLRADVTTQQPSKERFSTGEYELQALFDEALDAMLIADDAGSYIDVNPSACELLGLSREEILTKSVGDFLEPGVDFSQGWQRFLEQGRVRGESRVLRPDGTVRETENTAVANFVPHRHLSILRDITERKRIEAERNQIEAELLKNQRFIEQIAQSMPAILYVYDLCEQRNVYANRQMMEVLGLSAETVQAMGTGVLQILIHPDDWVKVAESLKQYATVRDGEVIEIEYRMRHANGEWIWLYSREVVLTRNVDGSSRQILGTATDITRIKQTEEELRQSQAKYRALSQELEQRVVQRTAELTREIRAREAALRDRQAMLRDYQVMLRDYQVMLRDYQVMLSDRQRLQHELRASQQKYKTVFDILPMGIVITDSQGKVLEVNPASEEIFGISAAEHCQRWYNGPEWQVIDPDGSPKLSSEYAGMIALTEQRVVQDVEMGVFKPDGEISWISLTAAPIPLERYGIVAVYVDITKRKQAEIQLVQTRNFLQSVLDHLPVAVFTKEVSNLRFVLWNAACIELMGYTAEDVLGKTAYEVFTTQHADFCTAKDQEVLASSKAVETLEGMICTKQGETKIVRNKKLAIYDSQGNPQYVLGFAEDITERKRAEHQLRASLQEKEVLLAEIHHRVKNNLYVICSLLELQTDWVSDPKAKAALEHSCNRVSSMALVHESLYQTHNFSEIDFTEYLQQLASYLLETYRSPASQVMLNFVGTPVFLSLDQAIPCGLLLNELITNALKHSFPEGSSGQVYIRITSLADGWIEIAVGNDGSSLPPDFDLQRNASMGVRLVIMLVEQLTGSLELEQGEITWFKVQFPICSI